MVHDEEPFEPVGALDGAPGHQVVALVGDAHGLRQVVGLRVGIERAGLGIVVHLGVGADVDRAAEAGLQIGNLETELVGVGLARCLIEVLVELHDVIVSRRE